MLRYAPIVRERDERRGRRRAFDLALAAGKWRRERIPRIRLEGSTGGRRCSSRCRSSRTRAARTATRSNPLRRAVDTETPTFVFHLNRDAELHPSRMGELENVIRQHYPFTATPPASSSAGPSCARARFHKARKMGKVGKIVERRAEVGQVSRRVATTRGPRAELADGGKRERDSVRDGTLTDATNPYAALEHAFAGATGAAARMDEIDSALRLARRAQRLHQMPMLSLPPPWRRASRTQRRRCRRAGAATTTTCGARWRAPPPPAAAAVGAARRRSRRGARRHGPSRRRSRWRSAPHGLSRRSRPIARRRSWGEEAESLRLAARHGGGGRARGQDTAKRRARRRRR